MTETSNSQLSSTSYIPVELPLINQPPKLITRNRLGLIEDPDIKYVFNPDNTISWRKMIKPEFLVPNKQFFDRRKQPVPTSIEGLEDNQLLILLGGIKQLCHTRGFRSVTYKLYAARPDYVMVGCKISWLPCYENNNEVVEFEGLADASLTNASGFGANFLAAIAENRAFVRAVRSFLRVNIVGSDEVSGSVPMPIEESPVMDPTDPRTMLQDKLNKKKRTLEDLKSKLKGKPGFEDVDSWNTINDIPKVKVYEIFDLLGKKVKPKQE